MALDSWWKWQGLVQSSTALQRQQKMLEKDSTRAEHAQEPARQQQQNFLQKSCPLFSPLCGFISKIPLLPALLFLLMLCHWPFAANGESFAAPASFGESWGTAPGGSKSCCWVPWGLVRDSWGTTGSPGVS